MIKQEYNTSKKKQIKEEIDKLKEKYPNYNFIAWHKDTDIDAIFEEILNMKLRV